MITIEGPEREGTGLAKVAAGEIAKPGAPLSVGALERALLARFPRADAEEWDRMGLLVGDPAATVTGVACALDPTLAAVRAAAAAGANVLLTHHPAFLDPPGAVSPAGEVAPMPGQVAFAAVRAGVALVNFHTALDVQPEAGRLLPDLLGLSPERVLVPVGDDPRKGYGRLCAVRPAESPLTLAQMAARCTSVFGRVPRVWGDFAGGLRSVVVANGSAGNVVGASLRARADCLVCGEVRYHAALDAAQAGLSIVELGHDVSELPLVALLADAAVRAGVPADRVSVIDQSANWTTPDPTRL